MFRSALFGIGTGVTHSGRSSGKPSAWTDSAKYIKAFWQLSARTPESSLGLPVAFGLSLRGSWVRFGPATTDGAGTAILLEPQISFEYAFPHVRVGPQLGWAFRVAGGDQAKDIVGYGSLALLVRFERR